MRDQRIGSSRLRLSAATTGCRQRVTHQRKDCSLTLPIGHGEVPDLRVVRWSPSAGRGFPRAFALAQASEPKPGYARWEMKGGRNRTGVDGADECSRERLLHRLAAAALRLNRRAGYRPERTEHAAVARLRAQECSAVRALVEELAGVGRHRLLPRKATTRAGQDRLQNDSTHAAMGRVGWRCCIVPEATSATAGQ